MKSLKTSSIFLALSICLATLSVEAMPLSDLALDQLDQNSNMLNPSLRSPFSPETKAGSELDPNSFLVQGVIYGKMKMALLSGKMLKEGEEMGRFKVDKILPNEVVIKDEEKEFHLSVENYIDPMVVNKKNQEYMIEFRDANLADVLKMLSKCAGLNLITPEDLSGRVTLSFEDIALIDAMRSILRVNGYEYAMEEKVLRIGKPDAFAGGTDLRTQTFHLKYATAKDLTEKIKTLLSDRGSVINDDRTNTLTVKDRDAVVGNINNIIDQMDNRDQQVQIEARIVDASKNFSRALGIRWGVNGSAGKFTTSGTAEVGLNGDTGNPLNVNLGAANPTSGIGMLIGSVGGFNIENQLTAAESKGDIQILSKPTVMTLNNMPSKIRSGTKIYVKSTSNISVGTSSSSSSSSSSGLQEINTGIELTVTPQISIDDYIKMQIQAIESEADFSKTVDGIPAILDNTANTTVVVKDGETAVIGGLFKQKTTNQKNGVPGLQNIPVMGYLFKNKAKTRSDGELMIFITPKIVQS
ncbi:MAG: hypothetical protein IPJ69_03430 [Deltaproteobacteria bacterium]|nr:MAG: hypothetical protein IPJ69_03430 [Deltaproteobacteria bacterium]